MKTLTLIAVLLIIGLSAQTQSIQKGKYLLSQQKPDRITINETCFGGFIYKINFEGVKGFKSFRNEDETKTKIKNIGELIEYFEERGYILENQNSNSGYNAYVRATITNNNYIFKRITKLQILRDAKEKLEFGLITQAEYDEIKLN